ncbi:MAG: tetratricopeptide repeat protein [Bacteroidetes bacterium]|nr:tetratricopeptide repeat protein [Bacteroidota bacterium]
MKRLILIIFAGMVCFSALAQADQDAQTLHETARVFMKQGDYENALFVLNKALTLAPDDLDILKDKAFVSYLKRDFAGAIETGKKITSSSQADVQSYQILGLAYKAIADYKNCEKMYKESLLKFPASGILYSEYGDMLNADNRGTEAIKLWEKGIEKDPAQSSNYYYASQYYAGTGNYFWSVLYGENFVNIESLSQRTTEIKQVLLDDYKKMYSGNYLEEFLKKANAFEKAVGTILLKLNGLTNYGITAESLVALRTQFILNWYPENAKEFPYKLFDLERTFLQEGYFTAYNFWLFEPEDAFKTWTVSNNEASITFQQYQRNVLFKPFKGQYYRFQ